MYAQVLKKHTNGSFFQKNSHFTFCTLVHNLFTKVHQGAQKKMLWAPKEYLCKCLCSEEVSYLAAGCSRTGGGRSHSREPSSSISQSPGQSSTSSLSGILRVWADWPWSPTACTGRFHMIGTRCRALIFPKGCAIARTRLEVGASSSTSIRGPWYGRPTKPAPGGMVSECTSVYLWHKA